MKRGIGSIDWGASYKPRVLTHCYVTSIHGHIKETVKTSQWLLVDDAARDRVRSGAALTIQSAKIMQTLFKR